MQPGDSSLQPQQDALQARLGLSVGTSKWYESREGKQSSTCSCEPSYQRCLCHGSAQLEMLVIFVH